MTLSSRFPVELYLLIVDNLQDDQTTLCVCSLVCKTFLHASRRHRFYTVHLNERRGDLFLDSIRSIFSPCQYVRHLFIDWIWPHSDAWVNIDSNWSVFDAWVNAALPLLSTHLLNVTLLHLRLYTMLNDTARAVIVSGFQQVKHLSIDYCKFETSEQLNELIASFPSLTSLSCLDSLWTSYKEPVIPLPCNLNSITLSTYHSTFFDRLLSIESHPNVRRVRFRMPYTEFEAQVDAVGKLLKTLGSSLKHLSFLNVIGFPNG
jgi:hypothetical protein